MCISSLVKYASTKLSYHPLIFLNSSTPVLHRPYFLPFVFSKQIKHTKVDNLAVHGQKIKHPQLDVVTMKQMKRRDSLICLKIFLRFQSEARNILW